VSDGSAYRRLLAVLLAWSLVPLVFNQVALLPFLGAAAAAALHLWRRPPLRLSETQLNLLGVGILLAVLIAGGYRFGPLRPLGHLVLLLTSVRAVMVHDRRSFLGALSGTVLTWMIAVATSTHVSLFVYLVASGGLIWWAGMRILMLGLPGLPKAAGSTAGDAGLPRWSHAALAGGMSLVLAVPVFLGMPRLPRPWLAFGRGTQAVSGFTDSVQLSRVGEIKESREAAITVTAEDGEEIEPRWTRLRGTAFDLVRTGMWTPRRSDLRRPELREGKVWLDPERRSLRGTTRLEVRLHKPQRYLFLPEGTVALETTTRVVVDPTGGIMVTARRPGPETYSVWVARQARRQLDPPIIRDTFLPHANERIRRIAYDVAGTLDGAEAKARAIQGYLREGFEYSLEGPPKFQNDPVAWFLLEGHRGHCEFFAGSMVVLLRHLEVPARMVGGYSGGQTAPAGDELMVDEGNAHTWVEVWLGPARGWVTFDPTPAAGVPVTQRMSGLHRLVWVWYQVVGVWDRYVLTFGAQEQLQLAYDAVTGAMELIRQTRPRHVLGLAMLVLLPVLVRLGLVAGARWRRQARRPATTELERLRPRLERRGEVVTAATTVRGIGRMAARHWPEAGRAISGLVRLAECELYAPAGMPAGGRDEARRLAAVLRRVRR